MMRMAASLVSIWVAGSVESVTTIEAALGAITRTDDDSTIDSSSNTPIGGRSTTSVDVVEPVGGAAFDAAAAIVGACNVGTIETDR